MGWEQGFETFFGSGLGTGIAIIACLNLLVDIWKKIK
jgi:hypothetical protein